MKFIAIDRSAAAEITSDRLLQSIDFDNGRALATLLQNPNLDVIVTSRITLYRAGDGLFICNHVAPSADNIVFDLEATDLFSAKRSPADVLLFLQKVLRFSIKYWNNLKYSPHERVLPNTSKAIIFPYPISQQTLFRIAIELSPDTKRQSKRSPDEHNLLVYRCGTDEGGGPNESVSVTTFRRFLEAKKAVRSSLHPVPTSAENRITSLSVTALDSPPELTVVPHQSYDRWLHLLTTLQRKFVLSSLDAPHRIEGPAGSGKTLCLILKALSALKLAVENDIEYRALFVTHSEATHRTVEQLFRTIDEWGFIDLDPRANRQSLRLTTLQQECAELLQRKISESEFLDRDAMESKQLQTLYIDHALNVVMTDEYSTYKKLLSQEFDSFISNTDRAALAEMVQHEISVVIKGRADENLDHYRKLPSLSYGLPTKTASDRGFVWLVFTMYQKQLQSAAQFDTDDIVLTTIGQLNTPIWRRRRTTEGYDGIYIDETHLFNINELSLFHYLSRAPTSHPIAYSVDRTQAIGDRGWTDELFDETLAPDYAARVKSERINVRNIFRCSPDIVNLAFSVTSSGATLFTNFQDPLELAESLFTADEERRSSPPLLIKCSSDDEMIALAFQRAERMAKELNTSKSDIAIVAFPPDVFLRMQEVASQSNKPVEIVKQRGDIEVVKRARQSMRYVLSAPEFVGGLEFCGVVLVGVDEGRVPPSRTSDSVDSANFLSYSFHNKLYVSITRAKYRLEILVLKDRGPSPLLKSALESGILTE